ncbi:MULTISPECIES: DinB family protein [Bacillus]|uniref:DinB family protein n=1 Tax=Bacillus TaxID=1386 RepID=UPI000BB94D64|nr:MULTISPECIES: DinB family protein [Bacillus]
MVSEKVLFNQLVSFREDLLFVLEDVTEEESELIPKGFRNNIHWNMGHILLDQYMWIYFQLEEEMPYDYLEKYFGYGTTPDHFSNETPTYSELLSLLKEQTNKIRETFSNRLSEKLLKVTELEMSTVGEVLPRTMYHEGLHIGTIITMKKLIRGM